VLREASVSLLKIGELAKASGLTVRALHHYDAIGLLSPSVRSEGGYRLYDHHDVARLHAIQALRRMGLGLREIGDMLASGATALPAIVDKQLRALDEEIRRATELRGRLALLNDTLASGTAPAMSDWLDSLALMSAGAKYFDVDELKALLHNLKRTEPEWRALMAAWRAEMAQGTPPDALHLQPLARRWINLSLRRVDGDFGRLGRWRQMVRDEPEVRRMNELDEELLAYIRPAVQARVSALRAHLREDEIERLDKGLEPEWQALAAECRRLMAAGAEVRSDAAQTLARRWDDLTDRTVRHDPALRAKVLEAQRCDPVLRSGAALDEAAQDFIHRAFEALQAQAENTAPGA
jgi:DNA-binding transcriptional MerR regulator